ncbi:pyridoxamine 5'-phosphate oxidase family protein [Halobacteria archaeon AArc-curdl1]|uniref:Pyridoxamine 5'-phosphate oxidase family protein n=1 Tax=Natronosalvus hydrolyticus TaxID=2979988 RepID=A0AAP2Z5U6_9EURY|nr:pyridoxamine 5'-phosphate oxidase family protein [Halobacteria archaeon AArc-curdl1]
MPLAEETEMTEAEIDGFLSRHETGVLALSGAQAPYAIPISYGYNSSAQTFYMRLVSTPESEKRAFLESTPDARLVVYEEANGGETYRSVVAEGTLEHIDPDELTIEHIEQYGAAKRPLFEIWGKSKDQLDIELYALEPTVLSGRRTEIERDDS